jgi:hypothetical protein
MVPKRSLGPHLDMEMWGHAHWCRVADVRLSEAAQKRRLPTGPNTFYKGAFVLAATKEADIQSSMVEAMDRTRHYLEETFHIVTNRERKFVTSISKPTNRLFLRSLVCNEPATSFGDDIEIFVNNVSAGGQFPIDQGQSRSLSRFNFDFDVPAFVTFKEDNDPAGATTIEESLAGQGVQRRDIIIKADGRYELSFEVLSV